MAVMPAKNADNNAQTNQFMPKVWLKNRIWQRRGDPAGASRAFRLRPGPTQFLSIRRNGKKSPVYFW
jgi:hypothetical protein